VDLHLEEQVERLQSELAPFSREQKFGEQNGDGRQEFHFNNGYFERVDAEVAYAFVRRRKPKRVIEVGSGNSTMVLAAALRANAAEGCGGDLTSIDPHPALLPQDGVEGLTRLIEMPVQRVSLDPFRELQALLGRAIFAGGVSGVQLRLSGGVVGERDAAVPPGNTARGVSRMGGSYERMPEHLKVFAPTLDGRNVWPCSFWIERQAA
jgi:hypothetical protein